MASVVLRAIHTGFDVDAFLLAHPQIAPEAVWRVGETRLAGRPPMTTSGFNLCVGEDDDTAIAIAQAWAALAGLRAPLERLRQLEVDIGLDVGLYVDEDTFSRNLRLSTAELKRLVDLDIDFEVSCYPCSSDDETLRANPLRGWLGAFVLLCFVSSVGTLET